MRRLGRVLWWAGPWVGLAAFVWRQQGLEARLAEWVAATNAAVHGSLRRVADASAEQFEDGIVGPGAAE